MFKPFFVYFNRPVRLTDSKTKSHKPRGFTAYIHPSSVPRQVQIRMTFCSSQDLFEKRKGRSHALEAKIEYINIRDIPKLLALAAKACGPEWHIPEENYFYIFKYVV